MKLRPIIAIGLSTAFLLLSATAGASINVKSAAKQFLNDIAPVNAALGKFSTWASRAPNSTTNTQAENEATPAIKALRTFQDQLLEQSWPSVAKSDVRTLCSATAPLEADLLSLSGGQYL